MVTLPILDVADVFASLIKRARTTEAENVVSLSATLYYGNLAKGKVRTIGQCIHRARLDCRAGRVFGRGDTRPAESLPVSLQAPHDERIAIVRELLDEQPDASLVSSWAAGNTMAEIGERAGMSEATVSRRIGKAIDAMRAELV